MVRSNKKPSRGQPGKRKAKGQGTAFAEIQVRIKGAPVQVFHVKLNGVQPLGQPLKSKRRPGSAAGQVHVAADFDAPLDEFQDYME